MANKQSCLLLQATEVYFSSLALAGGVYVFRGTLLMLRVFYTEQINI